MLSELFIKTVYAFLLLCFTFCLILHLSKIQKRIVYKRTITPVVISEIFLFTPIFFLLLGLTKKTVADTFLQNFNYLYTNQLIQLFGVALIISGLIIYIWALIVYVVEKKALIPTRGPYIFSRNPISLGFIIIPIATSISSWFNSIVLFIFLKNRKMFEFNKIFFINFLKIILASILMGIFFKYLILIFENQLVYNYDFKSFYLILSVFLCLIFYLLISFSIKAFKYGDIKLKY